jgi:predicted chitinase
MMWTVAAILGIGIAIAGRSSSGRSSSLEIMRAVAKEIDRESWTTSRNYKLPDFHVELDKQLNSHGFTAAGKAAILANLAFESGFFWYVREQGNLNEKGDRYQKNPALGNTEPGDGRRYIGRGFIQLTGRRNYTDAAAALSLPLVERPEIAEQKPVDVSFWYLESYQARDTKRTCFQVAQSETDTKKACAAIAGIIYAGREKVSDSLAEKGNFAKRQRYAEVIFSQLS